MTTTSHASQSRRRDHVRICTIEWKNRPARVITQRAAARRKTRRSWLGSVNSGQKAYGMVIGSLLTINLGVWYAVMNQMLTTLSA